MSEFAVLARPCFGCGRPILFVAGPTHCEACREKIARAWRRLADAILRPGAEGGR